MMKMAVKKPQDGQFLFILYVLHTRHTSVHIAYYLILNNDII
jgi:hypothetical protein